MNFPLQSHCPRGIGPPLGGQGWRGEQGAIDIPAVDSMQWLQAQKLPVIQAKGLELEHFHLSVSSHWITVAPPLTLRDWRELGD